MEKPLTLQARRGSPLACQRTRTAGSSVSIGPVRLLRQIEQITAHVLQAYVICANPYHPEIPDILSGNATAVQARGIDFITRLAAPISRFEPQALADKKEKAPEDHPCKGVMQNELEPV